MVVRRLVDGILRFCGWLSPGIAVHLGKALGWTMCCVIRFRVQAVRTHLDSAFPELTPVRRQQLLRGFYRHLGLLLVETLRLPSMNAAEVLAACSVTGLQHLDDALARGHGALVLAGHIGNWELGLAALSRSGRKSYAIVKEIKGKTGAYALKQLREAHGVIPLPRSRSLRQIVRILREGGSVGFVLDQNMTADEGVFVDFFGRQACTMPGLAVLAHRYHVPVVPIGFRRNPDLRTHEARFLPEVAWESLGGSVHADLRHNTQRYTRVLEDLIRTCPEQWLWIHKRWRTQPPNGATTAGNAPNATLRES